MIVLKKFEFSETLIITYMVLSSAAFVVNFAIKLREVQRLKRASEEANEIGGRAAKELSLPPASLRALASVTENTTRNLNEIAKDQTPLKIAREQ